MAGCFVACSLGAAGAGVLSAYRCARQVFHKKRPTEEALQSPPLKATKKRLSWDDDLLSLPLILSMS
ncbi:hypothetical protein ACRRTK_011594 [Alexandromys fortis]